MLIESVAFLAIVLFIAYFLKNKKTQSNKIGVKNNNYSKNIKMIDEYDYERTQKPQEHNKADDFSYEKYPFKKVFIANAFLDTPLKFLDQHGQVITITNEEQNQETNGFTRYGHWSEINEYTKSIIMESVRSQTPSVKILREIREIYEKESDYKHAYNQIKNICEKNKNTQFVIFNGDSQKITSYYYPSVMSFALGIKGNQIESLKQFGISTILDLEEKTDKELLNIPNIGKKTLISLRALQNTPEIPKNLTRMPRDRKYWNYIN